MSVVPAPAAGDAAPSDEQPTLKLGAISFVSNVVVGLASVAPAYSLAATFGFIVLIKGMGVHAPAVMLVSFIPILGVAYAFKAFNQIEPDCGTSFAWVTRAIGPKNGWLQGWAVFVADIIVMASLAVIASSYTFLLFGLDKLSGSATALVIGSIVWIAIMTWVAWRGIELSARTQQVLFLIEVVVIVVFSLACFGKAHGHVGHMSPTLEWFNPFGVSFGVLAQGVLLGLFIYWGWDTGVSINEETENSADTPGTAAVLSTFLLLAIYMIVGTATQTYGGTKAIAANPGDVFSLLGPQVLGSWFAHALYLIIVMSAAASTQTTIMPGARQALSMARRKSIPAKFGRIHPKLQTPDYATIFVGIVSAIWTVFLLVISPGQNVLGDSVTAVGFAICFYYGGTALAGAWYFRKAALNGVRPFIELFVLPLMGGVLMSVIFVYAIIQDGNPANTDTAVLGLGTPVIIGVGALILGLPLMFWAMARYKPFFRGETMPTLESYLQNQEDPSILAALEPDLPHAGA
jgi:amino acid transporter